MTSTPSSVARFALATGSASPAGGRAIDHAAPQRAARSLLEALGTDVDSESLRDTPRRVADA
jgi:GTP cyclohydrolase I